MPHASRKYIDLILTASSKWASWDPPHPIKVGDYGTVDHETGRFNKDGNVYDDAAIATLAADHPPITAAPDTHMVITAKAAVKREFGLGTDVGVPGLAEASLKGHWTFKAGQTGALLAMAEPRSTLLPSDVLRTRLADVPALRGKSLVTETVACHAYTLYLSSSSEDSISLALLATVPAAAPGAAGGEASGRWWKQTGSGLFRDGWEQPGTECYTPLFVLKHVQPRKSFVSRVFGGSGGTGGPGGEAGDGGWGNEPEVNIDLGRLNWMGGEELWQDVQRPWGPLNEEGEEEPLQDNDHDSEEE
ncbi:hypothetical protein B0H14DRAFT_1026643 [Mycena olivaceomarginata]|nr:hypothetical protein B0H14DRAFT_1026643 [Mycena olivaceomarginata]